MLIQPYDYKHLPAVAQNFIEAYDYFSNS